EGTMFTHATSPGSQTAVSLSSTFSGRLFSELEWGYHGVGIARFAYPADDPTPRFPELLKEKGITTAAFPSINFLAGDFGVARGFAHERVIAKGRAHALGRQVVDPAVDLLKKAGNGPLFLYLHLMEPHAPYDRGNNKTGTDYERYLSEVAAADSYVGRLLRTLK